MKKKLLILLALLVAGAMMMGPVMLGLTAVLFGASANAAQNPCISPIGVVTPAGGPVRLPVVGAFQVTSEYEMRDNPGDISHGEYRMHWGLDMAEIPGPTAVVAPMAGVVQSTPTSVGGGNELYIDHGVGLVTGYMHLSSRTVKIGDRVWAGQQIGVEGNTGNSSGSHLHFEVHLAGAKDNPRDWLTKQGLVVPPKGVTASAPGVVSVPPSPTDDPFALPGSSAASPAPLNPTDEPGDTKPVVSTVPAKVGVWQGEQVLNAGYVINAGQGRGLDAKTITIAVMTAMAESSLKNIAHGDAVRGDTIGLFQEGPERGPYEQRMDPTGATNIFFNYLLKVPNYLSPEPTIAAHQAQANADPYHYAPMWDDAVLLVATLTKDPSLLESLPAGGDVAGCQGGGPGEAPPAGDGSGTAIVSAAEHYLRTPYSWGGGDIDGPGLGIYSSASLDGTHTVGFDCSGLVLFAVSNATGVQLPHSAEAQGKDSRGTTIARDWSKLQPGDVISFSEDGSGAPGSFGHVGIYIGGGQMIHAPRPGKSVEIVQLKGSSYYEPMTWAIKRYAKTA